MTHGGMVWNGVVIFQPGSGRVGLDIQKIPKATKLKKCPPKKKLPKKVLVCSEVSHGLLRTHLNLLWQNVFFVQAYEKYICHNFKIFFTKICRYYLAMCLALPGSANNLQWKHLCYKAYNPEIGLGNIL